MRVCRKLAFVMVLLALSASCLAGGPRVYLKYASFDPVAGEPAVPADLRSQGSPKQKDYYVVQLSGPIEDSWIDGLAALGVELLDYVPDFAFLARMAPEVATSALKLDFVRWVGPYHPAYRISPRLKGRAKPAEVTVLLFAGESADSVRAEISSAGGAVHSPSKGRTGEYIEATIPPDAISRIARRREVCWIEPRVDRKLLNNVARGLMTVPQAWTGVGIYGSGEIVAVADTGLDTGNSSSVSADFSGRVFKTYDLGRKRKWDDPDGHGTHVCGSVLGSGVLSGADPSTHSYGSSYAGVAPEAQLIMQSIMDATGSLRGLPSDLNDLFASVYDDGARTHSNSWGSAVHGVYDTDSHNVDTFIWNHKDMVILFAAGNEGIDANSNGVVDADSLDSPATAKNCITVGASESYRLSGGVQGTYGGYWPSDYPAIPIYSDQVSNNSSGMVAFSSRGPTDDGRIKPDVLAPGTNIISCASHASGASVLWGAYNSNYNYCGGTSMATPLTAGAAALVRQYYRTQRSHVPTAALVKATLINGATDLYPGQYGTGACKEVPSVRPNNVEGWGLVNLAYLIAPSSPRILEYVDNTTGLSTGGSATYTYSVASGSGAMRATLVWTDYPASIIASSDLVNDLDLTVTLPNGSTLNGNSTTDRTNNVEGVDIASPATGVYAVRVSAYNVPYGPQPFAVVFSASAAPPPTAIITSPATDTVLDGHVTIKGKASGAGFGQYVLEYGVGLAPSTWISIGSPQTTPVIDGTLGVWDASPLSTGDYTIRLTATGTGGSSTVSVLVHVLKTSVALVKDNIDGTRVMLTGKTVTVGPEEFGQTMYVEEPDRTSGIKVSLSSSQTGIPISSVVTVAGTLQTADGERYIANPSVTVTGSAGP